MTRVKTRHKYILLGPMLCLLLWLQPGAKGQELPYGFPKTHRQKIALNQGWSFYLEKNQGSSTQLRQQGVQWQEVSIPHTLELAPLDITGLDTERQESFQRYVGWYQKKMTIDIPKNHRVFLQFEGVHQVTNLWVNGQHVGEHSISGYTPFHFDITDFILRDGQSNTLLISADNRLNSNIPPDGDRYDYIKFSGLYRDVYLVVTDPLHITFPWEKKQAGVFITTPSITPHNATVQVRTSLRNDGQRKKNGNILTRIIDDSGVVVAHAETPVDIPPGEERTIFQTMGILENLHLWSPDTPYLYRVNTMLRSEGEVLDCLENPLGIRKLDFVRDKGLLINGKQVELIGANRHQAYPLIGDAVPNSLHWKDALQLKEAGFNVVRLAHYPHDDAFVRACDELGLLIYEEPPTWIGIGNSTWMSNLEESARRMIRNHRNHPSILFWGAGINHRGPVPSLHYACKEEDPTRMTASNGSPWTGPRNAGPVDIYAPMDYQNMDLNPNEFVFLCEHGSSADALRNQFEVSKAKASANHIGVAVWTAHDYQSFKPNRGQYPRRIFSWFREPNSVYYWYRSELLPEPMVRIVDTDVVEKGKLKVFSNCEEVELFHNGNRVARQRPDDFPDRRYIDHPGFTFDFEWSEGTIMAKGLQRGEVVAEHTLTTGGEKSQIQLIIESDKRPLYADGSSIKVVKAYIQDKKGNLLSQDTSLVKFSVKGPGRIIGGAALGANPNKAYKGVASCLLSSEAVAGKITVTASLKGVRSGVATIETLPYEKDRVLAEARPIYDLKKIKVDIGGDEENLTQFGWQPWSMKPTMSFSEFEDVEFELFSKKGDLIWMDGWGMSANLSYVSVDGVAGREGVLLKITGLKKGWYTFSSYHHSMEAPEAESDDFSIALSSGNEERIVIKQGLTYSTGNRLGNRTANKVDFRFFAAGKTPITLHFTNTDIQQNTIINGFEISESLPKQYLQPN